MSRKTNPRCNFILTCGAKALGPWNKRKLSGTGGTRVEEVFICANHAAAFFPGWSKSDVKKWFQEQADKASRQRKSRKQVLAAESAAIEERERAIAEGKTPMDVLMSQQQS